MIGRLKRQTSTKQIPEEIRRLARESILNALKQDKEKFAVHGDILESILDIVTKADSIETVPVQLEEVTRTIGSFGGTTDFSRQDVEAFCKVAIAISKMYRSEVDRLMSQNKQERSL